MTGLEASIRRLGEPVTLRGIETKASLKESTKATYSFAARAYYVEGQIVLIDNTKLSGDYFERVLESNGKYLVISELTEPLTAGVAYIYACKCNAAIEIQRQKNKTQPFETIHSGVYCFRDQMNRNERSTNVGSLNQSIYTIILPHSYLLSKGDRVVMKGNVKGEYKDEFYEVEATSSAILDIDGKGIDIIQLSYDTRG